jgi:hypothetical protein
MLAGDPRSARDRLGEAVRRAREIEDQRGVCFYDCNLGFASYLDGAVDVAGACFDESLAVAARIGDFAVTAYGQLGLALLASRQGDHETAARLHGVADSMHARLGSTLDAVEARLRDADIASLRGVLGDAAFEAAYSLGRERDVDATPAPL